MNSNHIDSRGVRYADGKYEGKTLLKSAFFDRRSSVTVKLVVLSLVLLGLNSCSYQQQQVVEPAEVGSDSIKFSVSAMATYRYYSRQELPWDFAVTVDGERGFYSYCSPELTRVCRDETSGLLLAYCEERANKSCRIFAKGGYVVWKKPGNWRTKETVGIHYFVDHKGIENSKL